MVLMSASTPRDVRNIGVNIFPYPIYLVAQSVDVLLYGVHIEIIELIVVNTKYQHCLLELFLKDIPPPSIGDFVTFPNEGVPRHTVSLFEMSGNGAAAAALGIVNVGAQH
jgi:hypothetical protein